MKLSIIIPVYNEAQTIDLVLENVCRQDLSLHWSKEVIVVDDGSSDGTLNKIETFVKKHPEFQDLIRVHRGLVNHGKGAAVRSGIKLAEGEVLLIQDGDLEYSPSDYGALLKPFENPQTKIVYGTRFAHGPPRGMKILNMVANYILTWTVRFFYNVRLTDEATGFKLFHKSVIPRLNLKSRGFEFCPEVTSQVLLLGYKIDEVPISYDPRGIADGKKIKPRDGFIALWWLIKLRLFNPFK